MRIIKWIIGILLLAFIWVTVFEGRMSLRSIGENTTETIESVAETAAGQTVIERVESWFTELLQLIWDGFEDVVTSFFTDIVNGNGGSIGPGASTGSGPDMGTDGFAKL